MLPSPVPQTAISLNLIEAGTTAIAMALALAWPRTGSGRFTRIERAFSRLARRRGLAILFCGLAVLVLRLALLPICPVPLPFVPDDFSFLLASDTFVHGRLANPTPAMWVHFESIHIDMRPTYMSMYFPAAGLMLAAGKLLFGHPWFGVLCVDALLCAAACWMLQAWLPATWALLGGMILMIRLGLFSYWINTFAGGSGLLVALAGALVLGAAPRIVRHARFRDAMLLAVGIVILAIGRPYEGLLLCVPTAVLLGVWIVKGKKRPSAGVLIRRAALPLMIVAAGIAWLGYYDYRAFGKPTTLPYTVNRTTYATAPYFVWQSPRPEPKYHHKMLLYFYRDKELAAFYLIHGWSGFATQTVVKAARAILFFAGFALLAPLVMMGRVLRDRRTRFLVICMLCLMAGMVIEVFMIPHYLGPFTLVFYALGLQAMRHLRVWRRSDTGAGKTLVRFSVAVCVLMAGLRLFAVPLHFAIPEWPASEWSTYWFGPQHFGVERAAIEAQLEKLPGQQLVLVRYTDDHNPLDEWVYNGADIDGSKVVWAREMGGADNEELFHYYAGRKVWLIEPDASPAKVSTYPMPAPGAVAGDQAARTNLTVGSQDHDQR
jgi:hypothetical protein